VRRDLIVRAPALSTNHPGQERAPNRTAKRPFLTPPPELKLCGTPDCRHHTLNEAEFLICNSAPARLVWAAPPQLRSPMFPQSGYLAEGAPPSVLLRGRLNP
jgi:hypothetical protein